MKRSILAILTTLFSYVIYADQDVTKMSELEKCNIIADGYALMYQNHIDGWSLEDQKEFFDNVLGDSTDKATIERFKRQAETVYKLPIPTNIDEQKQEKINLYIRESANCLYDFKQN
ncbi:hypothetical protein [Acinetobacter baumannii]|uniref:hypothetical protein n=1 Tax=Acinetobacter baumannii TaxID=470 RepID=UPI0022EB8019|nr:hypothetical protein [Acinetobacter baumannii]MDA3519542.1 hypothetical protein [Acinetobacter baumannii]HAV6249011.1 hypothetical protein [Acinetobacter baumannii]HEC0319764.1 hypothetical protein [Acinetobacter baumannii]